VVRPMLGTDPMAGLPGRHTFSTFVPMREFNSVDIAPFSANIRNRIARGALMTRSGPSARIFSCSPSAGLLGLGLFLSACGGGGTAPPLQQGPDAVLNGSTLAAAASHWVSTQCNVQVELTSDFGFWSVVTNSAGTTTSGSETWAAVPDSNSLTAGPGFGGETGAFWVSGLGNITGSTSSQTFTATVTVETGSTHQNLGSCTFALTQHTLE